MMQPGYRKKLGQLHHRLWPAKAYLVRQIAAGR